MVEEIDLCDQSLEGEVQIVGAWGFVLVVVSPETASLLEQKKSWKSSGKLEGSNVCCCALVQPPSKFTGPGCLTKAEPPRKFLIGLLSELPLHAAHLPWPPGGQAPWCRPIARPSPIQLSSPVSIPSHPRHPARPPLPAPPKLKGPSYRRTPHRAPGLADPNFSF